MPQSDWHSVDNVDSPNDASCLIGCFVWQVERMFGSAGEAQSELHDAPDPRDTTQSTGSISRAEMEDLNMHTLFFLAQVHAALGNNDESAKCCHRTLQMQHKTGQYDPVEWGRNALSLAEHYMLSGEVESAEHCLKAAMQISTEAPDPLEELEARRKEASAEATVTAVAAVSTGESNAEQQAAAANELLNQEGRGELTEADKEYPGPLAQGQGDIHRTWGKLLSATPRALLKTLWNAALAGSPT